MKERDERMASEDAYEATINKLNVQNADLKRKHHQQIQTREKEICKQRTKLAHLKDQLTGQHKTLGFQMTLWLS